MGWFSKKPAPTEQWRRQPGEIAVRIEADDVKRECTNRPFVVYDGTVALIFRQGRLLGRLAAGKHDIDGPVRKWFVGDDPTVLVLTDDGDITLDAPVTGLYSQENIDLGVDLRLTLTISPPETFWLNVMKDRRRYTVDELQEHLRPEFHEALLAFTSTRPIHDLYHNADLRRQMEGVLRERAGQSLGRLGLSLVSLNVARVTSDRYDDVREQRADVQIENREALVEATRLKVLQKVRENIAGDKHHEWITHAELLDAMHQATHELGLKDTLRRDELSRLNARLEHDAAEYEQERSQVGETDRVGHELELDATKRSHGREQEAMDVDAFLATRLKEASSGQEVRDLERGGEEKDWELASKMRDDALAARRRMKMDDVELERERIESISKTDTATKIALGLGDKETLLELERLERQQGMSPEQLLVLAAEKSEAAAGALAERFRAEGKINAEMMEQVRQQIDRERQSNRESADRLERVMRESLQQMGKVATAKADSQGAGDQTIITSGGLGAPTVINPNKPNQGDSTE